MKPVLAFDVYGTLVDTSAIAEHLARDVGDAASEFTALWRRKQVEYAYRRGLMRNYADFATCSAQALAFACERFRAPIGEERRAELLRLNRNLPAFDDAAGALEALRATHRLFAFSNGTAEHVDETLSHAGLRSSFEGIVSVEEVRSFKPDPAVYAHARRATGAWASPFWLASSNAWDVIGARSAGCEAAWVRRSGEDLFDPWGIEPSLTVPSLEALPEALAGRASR